MSKLKINFILKSVKSEEKPVLIVINFGYKETNQLTGKTSYKPLKYHTGVKLLPSDWDRDRKLPLDKAKIKSLLDIQKVVEDVYGYLQLSNESITLDLLKSEIDIKLGRIKEKHTSIRVSEYIQKVVLIDGKREKSTLDSYKSLYNTLVEFESKHHLIITAEKLNADLFNAFIDHCRTKTKKINSVWKYYKCMKTVLREIGRKYKINVFNPTENLSRGDKVQQVSEDKIYLNYDQVEKIIHHNMVNERLKNVQFILAILVFTGCRYSDVFKIIPEHIYDKKGLKFSYAHFLTEKTDTEIKVPILKPLQNLFELNNNEPPYRISEQKFNKYVKELVELCGLDDKITLSYTNSFGKKEFEERKLFEFVTSHIGRRSFITNLINFVPITILAKITGHTIKDRSIIFGYNKITLLDNAALFVKELKRIQIAYKEDFPIQLVD